MDFLVERQLRMASRFCQVAVDSQPFKSLAFESKIDFRNFETKLKLSFKVKF